MARNRSDFIGIGSGLTRRGFLDQGLAGAAALGYSASFLGCGSAKGEVFQGACYHDCPDTCGWRITVENGEAVQFEADPDHPMTRGRLCPKMDNYIEDVVRNPDRLLYPLRRTGNKGGRRFNKVSWDEALDDVAARLRQIIDESGPTAILPYSFAGTQGMLQSGSLANRFFARLGASRLARKICGSAAITGVAATMGVATGVLPEDLVHSRLIILWGTNPLNTNPHIWPFIEEARRNGARLIVIDPLKTRTAIEADQHVQPIPGADAALALGMMNVIVNQGLHDADYVDRHTTGFPQLRERLAGYPPERAAKITGLTQDEITTLAKEYAAAKPSVIRGLIGMEHHGNGAMMFRTVACLPALVGAWRHRGGGLAHMTFSLFGAALNGNSLSMPELEDSSIRQFNMAQIGSALTDESLDPPVRAMVVYASNPAIIAPNQNLVRQGLAREDLFTVVLENFMTDTARYADYIFPSTTQAEHLDLMDSWGHRILALNRPALKPAGEAVPNNEFFRRLARRLEMTDPDLFESDERLVKTALRSDHPYLEGITWERLQAEGWAPLNIPEPWIPFAEGNFPTPSGKCEFYSESLAKQGLDPLPAHVPVDDSETGGKDASLPLMLLSTKVSRHFQNSSHANHRHHLAGNVAPRLDMHPVDAEARGLTEGDDVRVFNHRGEVRLPVALSETVRPGVVAIAHGWWLSHMPNGSSANALTPDGLTDRGGGSNFHDTRVEVEKARRT